MKCLKGLAIAGVTTVRVVCQILLLLENFIQCPYNNINMKKSSSSV